MASRKRLQYDITTSPVLVPPPVGTAVAVVTAVSIGIQCLTTFQYQAYTAPVLATAAEIVTADKWYEPLSDPVRQKPGLKAHLQQAAIGPVLEPNTQVIQDFESRWHQPWSEPVRQKPGQRVYLQQTRAEAPAQTPEIVTADKWIYPWSLPTPPKPALRASLQQTAAFHPTPVISIGWHSQLSEPSVKAKQGLAPQRQQDLAWSTFTPETINYDKWGYQWSEPVRQKPGLRAYLQQTLIAPVLDDETQIIQDFESRWHYAWSEPVRFRRLATAQQQVLAFQPPSFEIITADKWAYPWSEPVRQKPGLRAGLQQSTAQTVLDPDTQITQGYESRWHYPWSEPVRRKLGLGAHLQQAQAQGAIQPIEFITTDKWVYPWSEPKRFKLGILAASQQFLALDTAAIPASVLQPWFAPLSEPVRLKPGLRAHLQQAAIQTVLEPNSQIISGYESQWHYAWSEPVRSRRIAIAQVPFIAQPATSVFEIITPDKWIYPWSVPVRLKPGLRAGLQQSFIGTVLNPNTQITQFFESRWHYAWSEPVRQKLGLKAYLQQVQPVPVLNPNNVIQGFESRWHYPWSEPVRIRIDRRLAIALSASGLIAPVLNPNTQIIQGYESRWHYPWSEPVRLKPGLRAGLQEFHIQDNIPLHPDVSGILAAIERGDLFIAGSRAFNQVGGALVGFIEIVPRSALVGVQIDIPSVSANVGAVGTNPTAQSGSVAPLVYSANVSIRTV